MVPRVVMVVMVAKDWLDKRAWTDMMAGLAALGKMG
jgi:hypothetical protein